MTTSRTTSRVIIILLFLAGLLLLRKPVFGINLIVSPTHASAIVQEAQTGKAGRVFTPRASSTH
jgi:hypothetical protein